MSEIILDDKFLQRVSELLFLFERVEYLPCEDCPHDCVGGDYCYILVKEIRKEMEGRIGVNNRD